MADATQLLPAIWQSLTGLDLLLVVNKRAYMRQSAEGQVAMLDERLCRYADTDSARYETCEPDIQEFSDIVNRRKICFSNLDLLDALPSGGEIQRIEFDDEDEETEQLEEIGEEVEDLSFGCLG